MPPMALEVQSLSSQRHDDALPRLVGIEALAAHLGVSVRHIRRLVSERRVPFHEWGRLLRFDISEVVAWLDTVHTAPNDEVRR
jgi:excisionase family DNA binding protein